MAAEILQLGQLAGAIVQTGQEFSRLDGTLTTLSEM